MIIINYIITIKMVSKILIVILSKLLCLNLCLCYRNFIFNNHPTCNLTGDLASDEFIFGIRDMDLCEINYGYHPASNKPDYPVYFNATKYITFNSDQQACIYFYKDITCKQPLFQNCLVQQTADNTNITFIINNTNYNFLHMCYCYMRHGVCY